MGWDDDKASMKGDCVGIMWMLGIYDHDLARSWMAMILDMYSCGYQGGL